MGALSLRVGRPRELAAGGGKYAQCEHDRKRRLARRRLRAGTPKGAPITKWKRRRTKLGAHFKPCDG